jgi:8-oxo-dGTP diphosphatase
VGAVVRRGDDLLLVRRGRAPAAGRWSLPGGGIHPGEPATAAVAREVREETGLRVRVGRFLGWAERIDPAGGTHWVILDFAADPLDPDAHPVAGDDAAEAAWVPVGDVAGLDLVPGLLAFLEATAALEPGFSPDPRPDAHNDRYVK